MTTQLKYNNGAWVFWAGGAQPQLPETARALASQHDLDPGLVPDYAGDRATVARVFAKAAPQSARRGWLLRPLYRNGTKVSYAVVRESRDEATETLHHEHQATVTWLEEQADHFQGEHEIARLCDNEYQALRGKLVGADWTETITNYLLKVCHGSPVREDGRVYWVPPQALETLNKLGAFLGTLGIDLVLAEIESKDRVVVERAASESLSDKIAELQAECEAWDGTQKPSTYTKRVEEYTRLRKRATLYREALGIAVDDTQAILDKLEARANELYDIRANQVRHRDGSVSDK